MSLRLDCGTTPDGVEIGTDFVRDGSLRVGEYRISNSDMAAMCHYWLTNANLNGPEDFRLKLVACIKEATIVPGYRDDLTGTTHRIEAPNPLASDSPVFREGLPD